MFTASFRQLDADIKEDFLGRIGNVFGVDRAEASQLYNLLLQCMDHRESVSKATLVNVCRDSTHGQLTLLKYVFDQQITIFDSESEDQMTPDAAILTATLKGTCFSPLLCMFIDYCRHFDM